MKISPVNNTSFGKLRISNDTDTKQALRIMIKDEETNGIVSDCFKKFDEESGDTDVTVKIKYAGSGEGNGKSYDFYLNEGDSEWKDAKINLDTSNFYGPSNRIANLKNQFDSLVCQFSGKIDAFNNKVREADSEEFFKEFGIESNNDRNIAISDDPKTRQLFKGMFQGKRQLEIFAKGLRELEEKLQGQKLIVKIDGDTLLGGFEYILKAESPSAYQYTTSCNYTDRFVNSKQTQGAKYATDYFKELCMELIDDIEKAPYKPDIDSLVASYQ